jgi:hypothetical protein
LLGVEVGLGIEEGGAGVFFSWLNGAVGETSACALQRQTKKTRKIKKSRLFEPARRNAVIGLDMLRINPFVRKATSVY